MDGIKKKINYDPALLYFSNKTDEEKPKSIPIPTTETYNNSNRKHECNICGKRFFTINSLNTHTEHHTSTEQKSNRPEDDHRKDRQTLKKGTVLSCSQLECNFVALDAVEFQKHTIVCEGKRLTKDSDSDTAFCEKCGHYFASINHLNAHTVLTHSEGCSDISLNECRVKQIISDPVCLYVSENTNGENSSKNPTMYPGPDHPSFSRKKMKESDLENSSNTCEKKTTNDNETEKKGIDSSIKETITNGIHHCSNEGVSVGNDYGEFCPASESVIPDEELVTNNCDSLPENVNIEIIVVQPSAEETSLELTSGSDESVVCVVPEEIIEAVDASKKSTEETASNEPTNLTSKGTNADSYQVKVENSSTEPNKNPKDLKPKETSLTEKVADQKKMLNSSSTQVSKEGHSSKTLKNPGRIQDRSGKPKVNSSKKSADGSGGTSNYSPIGGPVKILKNKPKNYSKIAVGGSSPNPSHPNTETKERFSTKTNLHQKSMSAGDKVKPVVNSNTSDKSAEILRGAAASKIHENSMKDKDPVRRKDSHEKEVNSNPRNHSGNFSNLEKRSVTVGNNCPTSTIVEKTPKPATTKENTTHIKQLSVRTDPQVPIQNSAKLEEIPPITVDQNVKKRRKRSNVEFLLPPTVSERSVRSRKKLILPDFEYALDNKFEKDESIDQPATSTPKNKTGMEKGSPLNETGEQVVRKRGRPRKSIETTKKTETPPPTSTTNASKIIIVKRTSTISTPESLKNTDEKTMVATPAEKSTRNDEKVIPVLSTEESKGNRDENTSAASTTNLETDVDTSVVTSITESASNISEETEVFSLTTTMLEPDCGDTVCIKTEEMDPKEGDVDESWLKKLDFSEEQSLTDSWSAQPKRKLGRPPKRKKKELRTTAKSSGPSAKFDRRRELLKPGEKRKRGRPKKIPTVSTDNELSLNQSIPSMASTHENSIENVEIADGQKPNQLEKDTIKPTSTGEIPSSESNRMKHLDEILDSVVTIKKRGRPAKHKSRLVHSNPRTPKKVVNKKFEEPTSSLGAISGDDMNEKINVPIENKSEETEAAIVVVHKKRGRPKKSVTVEVPKSTKDSSADEMKIETSPELEKSTETTIEDSNMKKKREFMEYIRIKEDVDDSDHEPGKKSDSINTTISPPKKRGRPRLHEVARKRAAAAESAKNDRPYSIYNKYNAASDLKRRRNPLQTLELLKMKKNKKRTLLEDAKRIKTTSPSETANDSSLLMSDSSVPDDGATLNDDDLPYVVKKFSQKRVKKLSKIKPKKSRDTSPSGDDAKQDETKNIDPELYLNDMKNRAKYSRVFRKIREVPKHEEYFPNSLVTCGRCQKLMTLRHYHLYHQISHYFLCWLNGEKELDFSVDTDLIKIMQQYVNPDALRKKQIKLHCEQCHKIMKSVVGYVSHIRFCSKMNEEEFLGTCVLCGKKLKPSSLRHHYVKTHNIPLPNVNAKTKDELFLPVTETSSKNDSTATSTSLTRKTPKSYLNFERKVIDKSDIISDDEFWITVKTSYDLYMCMGLSCKHMTLSKDDLKNHILNCHAAFCEFKCLVCPFITRYESEIIYHTKNACKDFSDTEDKDDELEKSITEGRRVSNRVKKRKYRFDDEYFDDNERKKTKGDDDFEMSDDEDDDDDDDDGESFDDSEYDSEEQLRRKSRLSKRKSALYSGHGSDSSLRVAFLNHDSTRQYDPLNWTVETRQKICNISPILEEMKVNSSVWGLTSILNLPDHAPKQIKSMKVASDNNTFIDYNLFQSEVSKGVPICFVGGPVWALAWAPLPAHISEQYLAVAGLQHMNHLIELNSSVEFPSLIQIWKYGSLDNISNAIDKPVLDVAIAHKYGAVSCMEWCPSGGFDSRPSTCRLGILAVATSAGCVVVYSIPKLDTTDEPNNRMSCAEPDLILQVTCDNVQCTRVVWLRKKDQGVICGGFSNGTIALWNISTKSSLLRDGNKVYPYRTFEAHNASILALDAHWLDNGRYLLTSSIDRVMKYWDLEDLSGPLNEQEGSSPIVNVVWLQQWAVSAVGFDSSNVVDASAALSHSRDMIEKKKSITSLRDTCWSIAYSDWNDTVALSLCSGQVSVFAAKHMSTLTFRQPDFEKVVTETSLIPLNGDEKNSQEKESIEELTGLPETKTSYDCTSVLQEFGLKFCDHVKNKTSSTKSGFTPDCCNVISINKVSWNQNYNSFNWLAVGYESGFVRVFRVERFDKLHLTKFYKTNENCNVNSM